METPLTSLVKYHQRTKKPEVLEIAPVANTSIANSSFTINFNINIGYDTLEYVADKSKDLLERFKFKDVSPF